jgi:hypothetical protein
MRRIVDESSTVRIFTDFTSYGAIPGHSIVLRPRAAENHLAPHPSRQDMIELF